MKLHWFIYCYRDLAEEKQKRAKESANVYDYFSAQLVTLKQQIDSEKLHKTDDVGTISSILRNGTFSLFLSGI